jgi:AcrR family transcriptional regulator
MLSATAEAVAEHGYPTVSAAGVVRQAGVSRVTFFLAAFDAAIEVLFGGLELPSGSGSEPASTGSWPPTLM